MAEALHVLAVHGIGQQPRTFADDALRQFGAACAERGTYVYSRAVHWAPIMDRLEGRFLARAAREGSRGNPFQRLAVGTLSDALLYQSNAEVRQQLFDLLDEEVMKLRADAFTIFAHSLGGLIVTDYLRQRPVLDNVRLVTLGCNLGLFTLGQEFVPVPQLARPERWFNVFSRNDALGFSLDIPHVINRSYLVGPWFLRRTGLAHIGYFGDNSLWEDFLPNLLDI